MINVSIWTCRQPGYIKDSFRVPKKVELAALENNIIPFALQRNLGTIGTEGQISLSAVPGRVVEPAGWADGG